MPAGVRDAAGRWGGVVATPVPGTWPGGGDPSALKSVFCCAGLFVRGLRAVAGRFMVLASANGSK
jgi:hypothetical protein